MIKVEVTVMEISKLFLGIDTSKWKSYLFMPLTSPSNEIEKVKTVMSMEIKSYSAEELEI